MKTKLSLQVQIYKKIKAKTHIQLKWKEQKSFDNDEKREQMEYETERFKSRPKAYRYPIQTQRCSTF